MTENVVASSATIRPFRAVDKKAGLAQTGDRRPHRV
jgi:hypothetical protein